MAAIIVGRCAAKYFEDTLQTLLSVIGYWTVIHITVVVQGHFIFRRGWKAYDFDAWNNPACLPFGWAAIGAFAFSFLGAALGMKVAWYSGPIASLIGRKGANIGHELTFAFSGLGFPSFAGLRKEMGDGEEGTHKGDSPIFRPQWIISFIPLLPCRIMSQTSPAARSSDPTKDPNFHPQTFQGPRIQENSSS